jgi:hypothetical protein
MKSKVDIAQVIARLKASSLKGRKRLQVVVGYDTPYAFYVHENLEARHTTGQAKYLEQPTRELAQDMANIVKDSLLNKRSLEEGLTKAGKLLLDRSKELVPVDTGALRDSGFMEIRDTLNNAIDEQPTTDQTPTQES